VAAIQQNCDLLRLITVEALGTDRPKGLE
jgi:hypothetical protein